MSAKKSRDGGSQVPDVVFAEASVRSVGGVSLFDAPVITMDNVPSFYSDASLINAAVERLQAEGFEVLHVSRTTINIGGPPDLYERVFKTRIVAEERDVIKEFGRADTATILDSPDTAISGLIDTSRSSLGDIIEGVAINEPVYYFAGAPPLEAPLAAPAAVPMLGGVATPFPPAKGYWHLDVPGDVALGLNAERAHRTGLTGRGIRVVMVDSGWYRHPFFTLRGYRANPVVLGPAAANSDHDEHGHGTGESANIFSIAPDVEFTMVKVNFVNAIGAFNAACALKPDIISCSWGSSKMNPPLSAADQALAAAIASAVRQGIIVIFSAGNGHWGFPGQHPDVISAGGVYMRQDGSFEATPYASGFASRIYSGRNVPDVCGLVGLPPKAQYIMLPVEPGDTLDTTLAGGAHPNGDETPPNDGWAAFSGTSAAAPQLAGACALIKQACHRLTPAAVRDILRQTARDVTSGSASPNTGGNRAGLGPDLATGAGLADASKAAAVGRLRCLLRPPIARPVPSRVIPQPTPSNGDGADGFDAETANIVDMLLDMGR